MPLHLIILLLMLSSTSNLLAQSGASSAFTSTDPLLIEIRQTISSGGFPTKDQISQLQKSPTDPPHVEMLELLNRLRQEYSLTPQARLDKLHSKTPPLTLNDLDRWRGAGHLQYRT